MSRENISKAVGLIRMDYIREAMEEGSFAPKRGADRIADFCRRHRFAACICAAVVTAVLSFGTAFAANEVFRQTVIALLYPLYSDSQLKELEGGHMTGSFDVQDTLLSFLDRFNAEKMEFGIAAKMENGYTYVLLNGGAASEETKSVLAIVESTVPGYELLITMEQKPYEDTDGIWQILSYQVITQESADELKESMPAYDLGADPAPSTTQIQVEGDSAVIYNAQEKEKIVTLTMKESEQLREMLSRYEPSSDVFAMGPMDVVIRFKDVMYMLSEQGDVVIRDESLSQFSQITLTNEDRKILLELFQNYDLQISSD